METKKSKISNKLGPKKENLDEGAISGPTYLIKEKFINRSKKCQSLEVPLTSNDFSYLHGPEKRPPPGEMKCLHMSPG